MHSRQDNTQRLLAAALSSDFGYQRFLDSVLSPVADLIRLIHVSAARDIRAERWEARRPGIVGQDEVARQDRADEAFREWAYSGMARLVANMNVETDREVRVWDHLL